MNDPIVTWENGVLTIDLNPNDWWSEYVWGGPATVTVEQGSGEVIRRVKIEWEDHRA